MKCLRSTPAWGLISIPWAAVTITFTIIAIFVAAPFIGAKQAYFSIGKWWIRQQLWLCGGSWCSDGWENVPEAIRNGSQSAIFMSNHESLLDPPMLMGAIPVPAVYIAKKEVKKMPLIGWVAWAAGTIFIDRSNAEKAAASMEKVAEQIRQGENVVMFPEGTRTKDGKIGRFKKGGFTMAVKAGVPIIPLVTMGGWDVLPKGAMRLRSAKINVIFGEAVYPNDYATKELLMEEVERQIRKMAALVRP